MSPSIRDVDSVEQLVALVETGTPVEYVLFYGHTPKTPNQVDASCLSNWFPAPFTLESVHYPTTEHYMMAEKARLFDDSQIHAQIVGCDDPAQAKALGRKVRGFVDAVWNEKRFAIVVAGNLAKFGQNTPLKTFLLNTGDKVLVEASPRDRIWGIGMGRSNLNATSPALWRGRNLLGFALMDVRAKLR